MKNLEELFKTFCGNDESRPVVSLPFEIDGIVYATNYHVMIFCRKEFYGFEINNPNGAIKSANSVIPNPNCKHILNLNKQDFENLKTEIEYKKVGEDVDCSTCEGDGVVEWEFERHKKEFDCPECDGYGLSYEAKSVPTGNKNFQDCYVKLNNVYFSTKLFYKLIEVSEFLNEPVYLISISEANKPALFEIGAINVLVMPIIFNSNSENPVSIVINTNNDQTI